MNDMETSDYNQDKRDSWGSKAEFVLACIGACVGLGNFWRFPYLCYKSGGGAFLIPYFIMLFVCGIPLLLMELAVGQYTKRGPVGALRRLCPLLQGAGVGTVVITFLFCTYYNVIISWAIYYLWQSFTWTLPWSFCESFNSTSCYHKSEIKSIPNVDCLPSKLQVDFECSNETNKTESPSFTQQYYDEVVLEKSDGLESFGSIRIELLICMAIAWTLVYFCIWKSVKSTGKVVYLTAILPCIFIVAFLVRALSLPGASDGLKYLFIPKWHLLLDGEVWVNAAAQIFNSLGIAFGSLIVFSSYNKFTNNILIDTWIIGICNSATSLMAGIIVFATLGNIALDNGGQVEDIVDQGPGLAFVVYPQALAKMPMANVWSVIFFLLLIALGIDSQFASVEVVITSMKDAFPGIFKSLFRRHEILVLFICCITFVCGLPNIFQGGIYFFQLIDYYAAAISLMYLAFFEVIAVTWFYGAKKLAANVESMTSHKPSIYFIICWAIAAPILILAIGVLSWIDYKAPTYNGGAYSYPWWGILIGWILAAMSIIPIPIYALHALVNAKGDSILEKMKMCIQPTIHPCNKCGCGLTLSQSSCQNCAEKIKTEVQYYTTDPFLFNSKL